MMLQDLIKQYPQASEFLSKNIQICPEDKDYGLITYSATKISHKTHEPEIVSKTARIHLPSGTLYEFDNEDLEHISIVFIALSIGRPLQSIMKTAYHLFFPLSFYKEIQYALAKAKKNDQSKSSICLTAIARSLVDIFRTPLYGAVLTVIAIAGAILYPFKSLRHYVLPLRRLSALIENHLMWGNRSKCLARCQQPLDNLNKIHNRAKNYSKENEFDVAYKAQPGTMEYGFEQLAMAQDTFHKKINNDSDCETALLLAHRFGC